MKSDNYQLEMVLLPKTFYLDNNPVFLAKALLGKTLVSTSEEGEVQATIVETEAYKAPDDKGSHAYHNRKTPRNIAMFSEGGVAYMYKCYGIHNMFNVVTSKEEIPNAILIRAVEINENISLAKKRRKIEKENHILTGGPGKVCQAMGIKMDHNLVKLYDPNSPIRIYENGDKIDFKIVASPRVGMSKHVADYANNPWRFYIKNNNCISRPLNLKYDY